MGVEFASIFRSFGTEVTILEFLPRLVPVEDEEISKELARVFRKRGIEIEHRREGGEGGKDCRRASRSATPTPSSKPQVKEAEKVLVAVGRGPLTRDLAWRRRKSSWIAGS